MKALKLFIILALIFSASKAWSEEGHNYNYKKDVQAIFTVSEGDYELYKGSNNVSRIFLDGKDITPSALKYKNPFNLSNLIYHFDDYGQHCIVYELIPEQEEWAGVQINASLFPSGVTRIKIPACVASFSTYDEWGADTSDKFDDLIEFTWYTNGEYDYNDREFVCGSRFGVEGQTKYFTTADDSSMGMTDSKLYRKMQDLGFSVQTQDFNWLVENSVYKAYSIDIIPEVATLRIGDKLKIRRQYNEDATENRCLTWKSSNENIATVSNDGVVTAVGEGTAAILATTTDGGDAKAMSKITVTAANTPIYDYKTDVMLVKNLQSEKDISFDTHLLEYEKTVKSIYLDGKIVEDPYKTCHLSKGKHTIIYKGNDLKEFALSYFIPNIADDELVELRIPQTVSKIGFNYYNGIWDYPLLKTIYVFSKTAPTLDTAEGQEPFDNLLGKGAKDKKLIFLDDATGYEDDPWTKLAALKYTPTTISEAEAGTVPTCKYINMETTNLRMEPGDGLALQYTVDDDAFNKAVKWSSSDESVATVSAKGRITAIAEGTAVIKASATDGSNASASCAITVKKNKTTDYDPQKSFMFKVFAPEAGKELALFSNSEDDNKRMENKASSYEMTIDGESVPFTTKAAFDYAGIHTVTLTLKDKSAGFYQSFLNGDDNTVRIIETSVPYIDEAAGYQINECYYLDRIHYYTAHMPEYWQAPFGKFATDKILYVPKGCIGHDNRYPNDDITIEYMDIPDKYVEYVMFYYEPYYMHVGGSYQPVITMFPANLTDKKFKWTSSNTNVVTVDENGVATAVGEGKATISAVAIEGGASYQSEVRVDAEEVPVESITLDKTEMTMEENDVADLVANVLPTYATNKSLSWESSDENVAYVKNGFVMALKAGKATIKVSATSNWNIYATCDITVVPATSITNATAGNVRIIADGRHIQVTGLHDNEPISVMSAQGCVVYQGTEHSCMVPGAGIYLIKAKGKTMKFCVR